MKVTKSQKRRKVYSWKERQAYWMGVGAGANVDQLVSLYGSLSPEEAKSFENGHEIHKRKKK